MPWSSRDFDGRCRPGSCDDRRGSVSTSALRAPRSARSIPTSRVIPVPKRMFEAAI